MKQLIMFGAAALTAVLLVACSNGDSDVSGTSAEGDRAMMDKVDKPCDCLDSGLSEGQKVYCRDMKLEPNWLQTLSKCGHDQSEFKHVVHNMPMDGRYALDSQKSFVRWRGSKVGVEEEGTLLIQAGFFEVSQGFLNVGAVTVDMRGLVVTSLTGPSADQLSQHLRSRDFFDVSRFPTAEFRLMSSKADFAGALTVIGAMTVKGVTREVEGKLMFSSADPAEGVLFFEFDRTEFDVRYGSGSFFDDLGDELISDKVTVAVAIAEDVSLRR